MEEDEAWRYRFAPALGFSVSCLLCIVVKEWALTSRLHAW